VLAGEAGDCTKTYIIQPAGARISVKIFKTEMSERQIKSIDQAAECKVREGMTIVRRRSRPPNKENLRRLCDEVPVPGAIQARRVDADEFYNKIVKPYGSKRLTSANASRDDVVVYTHPDVGLLTTP